MHGRWIGGRSLIADAQLPGQGGQSGHYRRSMGDSGSMQPPTGPIPPNVDHEGRGLRRPPKASRNQWRSPEIPRGPDKRPETSGAPKRTKT
eukprot:1704202-Pyramimonas_sp.AAC.1